MKAPCLWISALFLSTAALAQGLPANTEISGCVASATAPTFVQSQYGQHSCDLAGNLRTVGGTSSTGSVGAAGTNGTQAQSVQGIDGGRPQATTIRATGTNRSATVGTTAVTLMAANTSRQGWKIKNDSAGDLWINFDTTATATAGGGNIKIPASGYLSSEPGYIETGAMSAIGSAAGLAITAREH